MNEKVIEGHPARKSLFTRAFWSLLVAQTCFGMSFSAFFLMPKFLKQELGASESDIGNLGALGALAGVVAFPVVGALNDRFGKKRFIVLGSLLMTLAAYLTLFVDRVGILLFMLRVAHGFAFALLFNSATTLVSDEIPKEKLGAALGIFGASMLWTNAASPAASEWIQLRWGWPAVFWVATVWGVVASILSPFVIEPKRTRAAPSLRRGHALTLLSERRARRILLLTAAGGAGFGTLFVFHQPYALELGMREVSSFFVAYAAAALVMRLGFLSRLERLGRQSLSGVAMTLYAVAVASAAFLRPGMLFPIGAITGLAHGVLYPVFNALAVEGVDREKRGSMMALYHGGFNAGMAVMLLSGGAIAEHFGFPTLFLSVGALTLVGAVTMFRADFSPEQAVDSALTAGAE